MENTISVRISYKRNDQSEKIADELLVQLKLKDINVIIDKTDLNYNSSISNFIDEFQDANYVICIISDGYLKSIYCVEELLKITNTRNYKDRIFPIVLDDATIYDNQGLIENSYAKYWEQEVKKAEMRRKEFISLNNLEGVDSLKRKEKAEAFFRSTSTIRNNFSDLQEILKDRVNLPKKNDGNFDLLQLVNTIEKKINEETNYFHFLGSNSTLNNYEIKLLEEFLKSIKKLIINKDFNNANIVIEKIKKLAPHNKEMILFSIICKMSLKEVNLFSTDEIEDLEINIRDTISDNRTQATSYYLWAIIKHDYYKKLGIKTSPTFTDLIVYLSKNVDRKEINFHYLKNLKISELIKKYLKI
jgi:hypothetical protein